MNTYIECFENIQTIYIYMALQDPHNMHFSFIWVPLKGNLSINCYSAFTWVSEGPASAPEFNTVDGGLAVKLLAAASASSLLQLKDLH